MARAVLRQAVKLSGCTGYQIRRIQGESNELDAVCLLKGDGMQLYEGNTHDTYARPPDGGQVRNVQVTCYAPVPVTPTEGERRMYAGKEHIALEPDDHLKDQPDDQIRS